MSIGRATVEMAQLEAYMAHAYRPQGGAGVRRAELRLRCGAGRARRGGNATDVVVVVGVCLRRRDIVNVKDEGSLRDVDTEDPVGGVEMRSWAVGW